MRLLVTRPQAQAVEWVEMLRAQGVDAQALPLIAIEPQAEPAAAAAWTQLSEHGLLVFVSPNAVERFFALKPAGAIWPEDTRAASTGPGTTRALRDAGVPASAIVEPPPDAEQFDSPALWRRLGKMPWHGTRVLVLRGDGGRDWLADQLRAAGATVAFVQVYRRAVPTLTDAERALLSDAMSAPAQTVWLFSSSQAVDHLRQLVPQAAWGAAHAWATHPRIADTARSLGFGTLQTVAPTSTAVVAAWRASIQSSAP
jgi:uroporphyrinogen-III synthase